MHRNTCIKAEKYCVSYSIPNMQQTLLSFASIGRLLECGHILSYHATESKDQSLKAVQWVLSSPRARLGFVSQWPLYRGPDRGLVQDARRKT